MRTLAATGNLAEAILAYDQLRILLREELGIPPAPELQALHTELLRKPGTMR
jgi:DNA-binding SARP family transcriptional activator